MSSKRRTISVADTPVKDAFTELEAFERDNSIGERTERRKELRENVLTALGLPTLVLERDGVKRAFDCLYRECRTTDGNVDARVIKQRSKVAEVARAQAKKARTADEHAAVAVLVALSGK
jgi:hypothetical protein